MHTHSIGTTLLVEGENEQDMKLGITGHQDFASSQIRDWIRNSLRLIVESQRPDLGYTCLARGTDQIFARILLKLQIPYVAIIASADYEKTFTTDELRNEYHRLLSTAENVVELQNLKATESAFFAASKLLVDKSDRVIAVWDGLPAKGFGGTADVVNYAQKTRKLLKHLNPRELTIS